MFVNFSDVDDRTALHIAAWQGFTQAVSELKQAKLISNIAGATLFLQMLYILQNHDVIKLLEKRGAGAKPLMALMHVRSWNTKSIPMNLILLTV